ncbi:cell division protein FtsQ/DivIB [Coriobacterium glomerans]|uniref:cell division protein FtsQ/DivIB n=1 Tax=Coriobacterium glomerans TaxID=33871 RepID=UPI0002F162A5|nr:FtsQ-type POTRA domain-containing protein [Coriobacterium glomerans]
MARKEPARAEGAPQRASLHRPRWLLFIAISVVVLIVLSVGAVIIVNSGLFAATDIQVRGSEHVSQQDAAQLTKVPDGATLLNVDAENIGADMLKNPWVDRVDIERRFPHTLIVTPHERTVVAIACIGTEDIAWAIGSDESWIAPVSLSVDDDGADEAKEPSTLTGIEAACAIAHASDAVVLTQVPANVMPASGRKVDTDVVLAGLKYAQGFSRDFISQIKSIDVTKVEGIEANLTSGVQVLLGEPEDIATKEKVIKRFLAQEKGVSLINVRTPGKYTFRGASTT